ncbi:agmatine deiminase family protein [Aliarcobacter butzleri]|uniref:agmatine deiminase family protein n=1 Tax=Aliarcobacter butzleri TaxID=28197 RepID=UPI002B24BFB0|nr:agmatine deiminase family protein [Aliarcobacter butzleri]
MKTTIRLSKLLFEKYPNSAKELVEIFDKNKISFEEIENTKDIWARDYMPICLDDGTLVSYIYEPNYLKNEKYKELKTQITYEKYHLDLIIDGGNFVRYKNKAIMTDKIFKENPSKSKDEIISTIKSICRLNELIIIPKQPYDTFGHSDSMVRWIDEKTVLINDFSNEDDVFYQKLLKTLKSHYLKIKTMKYSDDFFTKQRNWGAYLNFIKIHNILIVPTYGIKEDELALNQLKNIFTNCLIESIELNEIITQGGAMHCITSEKKEINQYLIMEVILNEFKVLRFKIIDNIPEILEYKEFPFENIDKLKDYLKNLDYHYSVISFDKNFYEYETINILSDLESSFEFDEITDDINALKLPNKFIKNGWVNLDEKRTMVLNCLVWHLIDRK